MKKVYLIYVSIPSYLYDEKIKYLLDIKYNFSFNQERNCMEGMYAWTDNKDIYKEFIAGRTREIYNTKVVEFMDKSEFKEFKLDNIVLMLDYRNYKMVTIDENKKSKNKKIQIVSTKNEYIQSTEDARENIDSFGPKAIGWIDYNVFTDNLIDALDVINYTNNFDINSEISSEERRDAESFQESFHMTIGGRNIKINYENEVNILLYLFRFFFFGDDKERDDDE